MYCVGSEWGPKGGSKKEENSVVQIFVPGFNSFIMKMRFGSRIRIGGLFGGVQGGGGQEHCIARCVANEASGEASLR